MPTTMKNDSNTGKTENTCFKQTVLAFLFGKGLKNFKDQVKSSKETNEVDAIDETSENKLKTAKKPSTSKTTKKKQTIKKKS